MSDDPPVESIVLMTPEQIQLASAAPQLLAACKRMLALIKAIDKELSTNPGVIFDAMTAIVKAEGVN